MIKEKQDAGLKTGGPEEPIGWHRRGYHPHCDEGGLTQFVTFRLNDSLPKVALEQIHSQLRFLPESERKARMFRKYEQLLDQGRGCCLLLNPIAAEIVQNSLLHFHLERYDLIAWSIMPNHVHVLIRILRSNSLSRTVKSWKSFTSAEIHRRLPGSLNPLWMRDYFDRYIRDEPHLCATVNYIEMNPVKAGLVNSKEDWKFGSAYWVRRSSDRLFNLVSK